MASRAGNRKISANRSKQWAENLKQGRREALLNPTRLRLLRLKRGLSQDQAAQALGLSTSTYQAVERAKRLVDQERAEQIASYFKIPFKNLFVKAAKTKFEAVYAVYE